MPELDRFTCQDVFRRLDDYLDRELSPDEIVRVEAHLADCAVCAAEHRFERQVLEGVRARLRRIAAPAGLLRKVQAAIADAAPPPC